MKATFTKAVLACSVAAAALFAGSASAATYNPFTVAVPGTLGTQVFTADKITGGYSEVATFNANGTFDVSLKWDAGQFFANQGSTLLDNEEDTRLGFVYGMYATYKASGTFVTDAVTGDTSFKFSPGTGNFKLMLDNRSAKTKTVSNPTVGTGDFILSGATDDVVLANGDAITGDGKLSSTASCTSGINCGSFGSTTTFVLTADGSKFFTAPSPFYNLSFQSGQLNTFKLTGTQLITGSLDVVFNTEVPEPASLALLGLGILGLGVARRRKQA